MLPGEPFDPPAASQVPARARTEPALAPAAPGAALELPADEQAYGAPAYQDAPVYGTAVPDHDAVAAAA